MSIDPKNDRSCYYERIMNGFINVEGYCNIRGAAEKIVELEERNEQPVDCREAFEKWAKDEAGDLCLNYSKHYNTYEEILNYLTPSVSSYS